MRPQKLYDKSENHRLISGLKIILLKFDLDGRAATESR